MKKSVLYPLAFLLAGFGHAQNALLPRILTGPAPKNIKLAIDSQRVAADDWYYFEEKSEILLLRGDSLFRSCINPLHWTFLGRDPLWRGRRISGVYSSGRKNLAVLFTLNDGATKGGAPPVLWFMGQPSFLFSPMPPGPDFRWHLNIEPRPVESGMFLQLSQDIFDETSRNSTNDSMVVYWLDLHKSSLIRLPYSQMPDFYDSTLSSAYFKSGYRIVPEENQSYYTYDRFDLRTHKIQRQATDIRLNHVFCSLDQMEVPDSYRANTWKLKNPNNRDDDYELVSSRLVVHGHLFPPTFQALPSFDPLTQPPFPVHIYAVAGQRLYYICKAADSQNDLLFRQSGLDFMQIPSTGRFLYLSGFNNGNALIFVNNRQLPYPTNVDGKRGKLYLLSHADDTWIDLSGQLQRHTDNPVYDPDEVFLFRQVEQADTRSTVTLGWIEQGFLPLPPALAGQNPKLDQYWERMKWSGVGPRLMERVARYALIREDGQLYLFDLPFIEHPFDFSRLLFHPSGILLGHDYQSGDLHWWRFDLPF